MTYKEFISKVEKCETSASNVYNRELVPGIRFYRSLQIRHDWESNSDPEVDDIAYHFTEVEATEAAKALELGIGFTAQVETISIDADLFNDEFTKDDEFELHDIVKACGRFSGFDISTEELDTNDGKDITGAIIVEWSWEKHVGYCRNLHQLGIAGEWPFDKFKTEKDLISGNEERTFRSNYSVLLTKEEKEEAADLEEAIDEAINASQWKWNYFRRNPETVNLFENIQL